MTYELAIDGAPATVPGGTAILLLYPSTVETDRIDTAFLKGDADAVLVVSTRTTAREVSQKLDHYDVDGGTTEILDALSVERGYTRRQTEGVRYVSAPDDLDGIVSETESFLAAHDGDRRVTVDSITEMIYYADVDRVALGVERLVALLEDHDAVGLFHMASGVHDEPTVSRFRAMFDGVLELDADGDLAADFE